MISKLQLQNTISQSKTFCTKEIGNAACCNLYLSAEPCVDECRKNFLDRDTWQPTKEYDECESMCRSVYSVTCQKKDTMDRESNVLTTKMRRKRPDGQTTTND